MSYHPERRLRALAELTGLPEPAVRRRLFDSGFGRALDEGRIKARDIDGQAEKHMGKRLGQSALELCWAEAFEPMDAVLALAKSLRPGLATAVISNNNDLTRRALQRAYPGALDGFRPVLFSSDVGSCKPESGIYMSLATLMDLAPEEILIVDDDALNIAIADSLGFQTHLFTTARSLATALSEIGAQ